MYFPTLMVPSEFPNSDLPELAMSWRDVIRTRKGTFNVPETGEDIVKLLVVVVIGAVDLQSLAPAKFPFNSAVDGFSLQERDAIDGSDEDDMYWSLVDADGAGGTDFVTGVDASTVENSRQPGRGEGAAVGFVSIYMGSETVDEPVVNVGVVNDSGVKFGDAPCIHSTNLYHDCWQPHAITQSFDWDLIPPSEMTKVLTHSACTEHTPVLVQKNH